MSISIENIREAHGRIESAIIRTPCRKSQTLSSILGLDLFIKFENAQFTASFKERGALNKLLCLEESEKGRGVIAMSAGNHAQAVAYHARRLGIPATIVMSKFTPNNKVEDTRKLGATVILEGDTLEQAAAHAHNLAERDSLVFVHPFNDEHVIAGQGTLAVEMLESVPDLDALIVPVGGGGLISGVAIAAKALNPSIKIYGVQSKLFPGVAAARDNRKGVRPRVTVAEGIAVKQPGTLTLPIIDSLVDDVFLVDEEAIEEAVYQLIHIEKTVSEGAGAVGLAALNVHKTRFQNQKVGIVLSGANIDSRILASILMRNLARTGRIARLHVKIDDTPGALAEVCDSIGQQGGNIIEVNHQRTFAQVGIKEADLILTVETRDRQHADEIIESLSNHGFKAAFLASLD